MGSDLVHRLAEGDSSLLTTIGTPDQTDRQCYLSVCRLTSSNAEAFPSVEGELQRIVGENLRAYRKAKGLSQEDFADVIGVHRTYMGGVERGERNLTLRSVEKIADTLGLDPLVLLSPSS